MGVYSLHLRGNVSICNCNYENTIYKVIYNISLTYNFRFENSLYRSNKLQTTKTAAFHTDSSGCLLLEVREQYYLRSPRALMIAR